MSQSPQHRHYPVLDGLRGIAIGLVLVQHFFQRSPRGEGLADAVAWAAAGRSWMGVDLFFVLSGFLITGILLRDRGQVGYFRNFYARRVLRIFPAYYALLAIAYGLLPRLHAPPVDAYLADSIGDQVWHWTYLTNLKIALNGHWYEHHIPNVFWSLAIEEQFYMVWPLVVWFAGPRALERLCQALFVFAAGLRMYLAWHPEVHWVESFVLTPTRMDGLVLGSLFALWFRQGRFETRRFQRGMAVALGLAALVTVALTLHRPDGWRELPIQSLRFSSIALGAACLLWLAMTLPAGNRLARALSVRPLRFFGKYSYALYLWHGPADALVRYFWPLEWSARGSHLAPQLAFVAVAGGLSVLFALASWHLLEKHCLRLKARFA
ncbi:MAG: acyltransferase [Planctomycetota bacterium]